MEKKNNKFALIVAGGKGLRLGEPVPKQFIEIKGRAVLARTIDAFLISDPNIEIFVPVPESLFAGWKEWLGKNFLAEQFKRIHSAKGGKERIHSVHSGLQAINAHCIATGIREAWVAIHDGVRPFVTNELIRSSFALAEEKGNAVAAVPVKSSMRILEPDGFSKSVDRSRYFHVQTPQVFRLNEILLCYENRPNDNFTDDASIAEIQGVQIFLSEGSYENIKITTREDLTHAELILEKSIKP